MNDKIIILGDVHIGKSANLGKNVIGSNLNSRVSDQCNLLDWTLDQAVEFLVGDIIITGDLFEDPKPHPTLISLFISWLKKCQIFDVKVHIILGNHDMIRSGSSFTSSLDVISEIDFENVSIYKDIDTIFINSTSITMLPFRDRKCFSVNSNQEALDIMQHSLNYELSSIPLSYNKIVIGHLAIEGSIPVGDEIDDLNNEIFCPISMFKGFNYVWMGHVHSPQVMNKQNPYVAHIGSMDISNFSENDQKKKIIVFDLYEKSFYEKNIPVRSLRKISVVVPKDAEDSTQYVIDYIKSEKISLKNSIVKVDVSLSSPDIKSLDKSKIESFLNENNVFSISGISESKKVSLIKKDLNSVNINTNLDMKASINLYCETYIEVENQSAFKDLALEILLNFKNESK